MECSYFITGTDTEVGKTFVTNLLLSSFSNHIAFKPIACGDRADAEIFRETLAKRGFEMSLDEINPIFFAQAIAPLGVNFGDKDFKNAKLAYKSLAKKSKKILVEGIGGWECPLSSDMTMADFAVELNLPILLVADDKLGVLNHTILTLRSIYERGLRCAGFFLNNYDERDLYRNKSSLIKILRKYDGVSLFCIKKDQEKIFNKSLGITYLTSQSN